LYFSAGKKNFKNDMKTKGICNPRSRNQNSGLPRSRHATRDDQRVLGQRLSERAEWDKKQEQSIDTINATPQK
jgi:hypothetical protein